jgi:Skp family chaperone for outer membrane proteins
MQHMKSHPILATATLLLSCLLTFSVVQAAKVPPPVIAVLDTEKVFRESKAGANAIATIRGRAKEFEQQIYAERDRLKAKEAELVKQKSVLAKEELQRRGSELQRQKQGLRLKAESMRANLNRGMEAAKVKLTNEIRRILPDIQKRKGITIVIDRNRVLTFHQELNITDEVIAELNKKVTKIDLDPAKKTN